MLPIDCSDNMPSKIPDNFWHLVIALDMHSGVASPNLMPGQIVGSLIYLHVTFSLAKNCGCLYCIRAHAHFHMSINKF